MYLHQITGHQSLFRKYCQMQLASLPDPWLSFAGRLNYCFNFTVCFTSKLFAYPSFNFGRSYHTHLDISFRLSRFLYMFKASSDVFQISSGSIVTPFVLLISLTFAGQLLPQSLFLSCHVQYLSLSSCLSEVWKYIIKLFI